MRKKLLALLALFVPCTLQALPVGNPWDASLLTNGVFLCREYPNSFGPNCPWWNQVSFRTGFSYDHVFNRRMEIARSHGNYHQTEIVTNAALLAVNFWDRIDLFSRLGVSRFNLETRTREIGRDSLSNRPVWIETDTHFSWNLGVKGTIWQWGCLGFGGEAQYFQTRPHLNFAQDDAFQPFYFPNNQRIKYEEWQVNLGVSYKVNIGFCSTSLLPYAAVKWEQSRLSFNHPTFSLVDNTPALNLTTLHHLRDQHHWGYALGITLVGCDKVSMTLEGRFVNERALHFNTQFRF